MLYVVCLVIGFSLLVVGRSSLFGVFSFCCAQAVVLFVVCCLALVCLLYVVVVVVRRVRCLLVVGV